MLPVEYWKTINQLKKVKSENLPTQIIRKIYNCINSSLKKAVISINILFTAFIKTWAISFGGELELDAKMTAMHKNITKHVKQTKQKSLMKVLIKLVSGKSTGPHAVFATLPIKLPFLFGNTSLFPLLNIQVYFW